jgi:16S rRNA (cytosine1402-N4)-methyltransferase
MTSAHHIPVLLEEVITHLNPESGGTFIDGTLGLGGHSLEILKRFPKSRIIGFDLDEKSLLTAKQNLHDYADRVELYHSDFRYIPDLKINFSKIKGVLIDLGISSYQLDTPERGFSYSLEGPLDMRMDLRNKCTASRIINKYSEPKLAQVLHEYGELRQSRKIAGAIASRRKLRKIETTTELFRIVEETCRWRPQKGKTHPAARVFQAIRIEVNQELKELGHFFERLIQKTSTGCRIVAISFHSLEDRIIKHTLVGLASQQAHIPLVKILTKKPVRPSEEEIEKNFRSRSAKLRAAERK